MKWLLEFPTHVKDSDYAVEIADLKDWSSLPSTFSDRVHTAREAARKITGGMTRLQQLSSDIRFILSNPSLFWPEPKTDTLEAASQHASIEYDRLKAMLQRYQSDFLHTAPAPDLTAVDNLINGVRLPKLADKIVMVECFHAAPQFVEDLPPGELALIGLIGRWRGGPSEIYRNGQDMTGDVINHLIYARDADTPRKVPVNKGLCLVGSDGDGAIIRIALERANDQCGTPPDDPLRVIYRRVTGATPEQLARYRRI